MSWRDLVEEWDTDLRSGDPLRFPGYADKLSEIEQAGGVPGEDGPAFESVRTGRTDAYVLVENAFEFLGGSMGAVHGEKVVRAFRRATDLGLPVVAVTRSGGARMQEGMVSLIQMARTAAAQRAHADAGLLSVAVFRSPTTGGVFASYGSLCDLRVAEADAVVGFAGPRVAAQTVGEEVGDRSHSAERAHEAGLVDAVVPAGGLAAWVEGALGLRGVPFPFPPRVVAGDQASPEADAPGRGGAPSGAESGDVGAPGGGGGSPAAGGGVVEPPGRGGTSTASAEDSDAGGSEPGDPPTNPAWAEVERARRAGRPTGVDVAAALCTSWTELAGTDPVTRAGLATVAGRRVVVIAHDRYAATGRPLPAGFRLAQRAVALAGRLGLPVVTLIDTPGAEPGWRAEQDGIAAEIARTFAALAAAPVPTVAVCVGEGGSGGALALGAADRLLIQRHAIFSVIGPEGAAAILLRDSSRAPEVAERLALTSGDLARLGIVDAVVPDDIGATVTAVGAALEEARVGDRHARLDAVTAAALG